MPTQPQLLAQGSPFGDSPFTPPSDLSTPVTDADSALSGMERIISLGLGTITTLAGIFFIVVFLQGSFEWVTAGGEKGKLESARGKMLNGVLGLVLIIMAYAIIGLVGTVLGFDILNPGNMIRTVVGI